MKEARVFGNMSHAPEITIVIIEAHEWIWGSVSHSNPCMHLVKWNIGKNRLVTPLSLHHALFLLQHYAQHHFKGAMFSVGPKSMDSSDDSHGCCLEHELAGMGR